MPPNNTRMYDEAHELRVEPLDLSWIKSSNVFETSLKDVKQQQQHQQQPKQPQQLKPSSKNVAATKWAIREMKKNMGSTLSFWSILLAYHAHCEESNQEALPPQEMLDILRSLFVEVSEEELLKDSLSLDKKGKEDLASSLLQLRFEAGNPTDAALKRAFTKEFVPANLNIRLKKTLLEEDDDGDSSDSGASFSDQETDSSSEREKCTSGDDSSYESTDENDSMLRSEYTKDFSSQELRKDSGQSYICQLKAAADFNLRTFPSIQAQRYFYSKPPLTEGSIKKEPQDGTQKDAANHDVRNISIKRELETDVTPCLLEECNRTSKGNDPSGTPTKRGKWSEQEEKIMENVLFQLDTKGRESSPCYGDSQRLARVLVGMMKKGQLSTFLSTFAHSMTCKEKHTGLCLMFKRIILHVGKATTHDCAVIHVYGHVLRLHLDTCKKADCGIPNCKAMRESRSKKTATK